MLRVASLAWPAARIARYESLAVQDFHVSEERAARWHVREARPWAVVRDIAAVVVDVAHNPCIVRGMAPDCSSAADVRCVVPVCTVPMPDVPSKATKPTHYPHIIRATTPHAQPVQHMQILRPCTAIPVDGAVFAHGPHVVRGRP